MSIIENRYSDKLKIYPDKLNQGDTIGVVAPAGSFNKGVFKKGIKVLEKMGFNLYLPEEIMLERFWFAGDDEQRAELLQRLFADADIKAILCARGGYGAMRILDKIDFDLIRKNPKIFAGFSDISALLAAFYQRAGLVCYHAPVVTSLALADTRTIEDLKRVFTSRDAGRLYAHNGVEIFKGKAEGRLAGGNLTTLNHLVGTEFSPDYQGTILMLEDIGEAPYKIDRMLMQMKLAGVFNGICGLALGLFEGCGSYDEIISVFEEAFYGFDIPVVAGFEFGHSDTNLSFPVGGDAQLDSNTLAVTYKQQ